jgi:hypothetical protein
MYKTLTEEQLFRFYPGKESIVRNLLTHLARQGRIYRNPEKKRVSVSDKRDANPDAGLLAAVWVLIDFIDRAECHYAGDFPVKICFFSDGEVYEIIHVPCEQEILMNHALAGKSEISARRIVLVDDPGQIEAIRIPNATGFCSVDTDGAVRYYKIE